MKKNYLKITILSCCMLFLSQLKAIPPGNWFYEIFGCTYYACNIETHVVIGSVPPMCYKTYDICSRSWLWGSCGTTYGGNTGEYACSMNVLPIIDADIASRKKQLWKMGLKDKIVAIEGLGYPVPIGWKDTSNYDDSTTLKNIVVWRLRLAGYDANLSWLLGNGVYIPGDPLPHITLDVLVPQAEEYGGGGVPSQNQNTSISQLVSNYNLVVFPNPSNSNSSIKISFQTQSIYCVNIFDSEGKLVYSNNDYSDLSDINIENWSKGIYFVKTSNSNGDQQTSKLLKD